MMANYKPGVKRRAYYRFAENPVNGVSKASWRDRKRQLEALV
jgi:hypothetical protein